MFYFTMAAKVLFLKYISVAKAIFQTTVVTRKELGSSSRRKSCRWFAHNQVGHTILPKVKGSKNKFLTMMSGFPSATWYTCRCVSGGKTDGGALSQLISSSSGLSLQEILEIFKSYTTLYSHSCMKLPQLLSCLFNRVGKQRVPQNCCLQGVLQEGERLELGRKHPRRHPGTGNDDQTSGREPSLLQKQIRLISSSECSNVGAQIQQTTERRGKKDICPQKNYCYKMETVLFTLKACGVPSGFFG